MNKFLVILTALLLSGCAAKVSQLQTPEKIEYNGKTYKLTASQDLDTIARYVYLAEPDTLENWQSQIEVLLDRDLSRSMEGLKNLKRAEDIAKLRGKSVEEILG